MVNSPANSGDGVQSLSQEDQRSRKWIPQYSCLEQDVDRVNELILIKCFDQCLVLSYYSVNVSGCC